MLCIERRFNLVEYSVVRTTYPAFLSTFAAFFLWRSRHRGYGLRLGLASLHLDSSFQISMGVTYIPTVQGSQLSLVCRHR